MKFFYTGLNKFMWNHPFIKSCIHFTILKIAVIANTAIGSAAKPNRLCSRSKYIFNKKSI